MNMDHVEDRTALLEQYPRLKEMHQQSVELDYRKEDFEDHKPVFCNMPGQGRVTMTANHKLFGPERETGEGNPLRQFTLTEHAWGQLGGRLGPVVFGPGNNKGVPRAWMIASADHKDSGVRTALAAYLNTLVPLYIHEKTGKAKPWLLRTFDRQVRAVLTNRYAIVDNTPLLLLRIVAQSLANQRDQAQAEGNQPPPIEFGYSRLDADWLVLDCLMRGVDPHDDQDENGGFYAGLSGHPYSMGFRLKNNEIGGGAISVSAMIKRHSCNNSITLVKQQVRLVHQGLREFLVMEVTAAIGQAMMLAPHYLNHMMQARAVPVPDFHKKVDDLCAQFGWSTEVGHSIRSGSEGRETLYGLVNGISFAAHSAMKTPEDREWAEDRAGELLVEPSKYFKERWAREAVLEPIEIDNRR